MEDASEGTLVTATVRENAVLMQWLLSWGDAVEVLGPPSLRKGMAAALRDAADQYA